MANDTTRTAPAGHRRPVGGQPEYWRRACRSLSGADPVMAGLIRAFPGSVLTSRGQPFATLLRSIVGQQISVKAADAVWQRPS